MGKMPNQMVSSGTRMKVGVAMEATMYDHTPEQNRICARHGTNKNIRSDKDAEEAEEDLRATWHQHRKSL